MRPGIYPWNGEFDDRLLTIHGRVVATVDVKVDHKISTSAEDTNQAYRPLLHRIIKAWKNSRHYDPEVPLPVLGSILPALLAKGYCEPSVYGADDTAKFANHVRNQYQKFSMRQIQDTAQASNDETRVHYRDTKKRRVAAYIDTVMHGRQFWITQERRLTTAVWLRKGDLICIMHGCSHPVAIRHVYETAAQVCTVVGTCYLEDWMDPWGRGKVDWKEEEAQEFQLF